MTPDPRGPLKLTRPLRRADMRHMRGRPHHPRAEDILLVIEVADTTVAYDRDIKMPLYARAGVPEGWLVDLDADRVEVCREPADGRYTSIRLVSRGDTITPLRFPNMKVSADEVLG